MVTSADAIQVKVLDAGSSGTTALRFVSTRCNM